MNRLSNYFGSARLAKMHLAQAEHDVEHKENLKALKNLLTACRHMVTAQNNVASIAFKPKKKGKRNGRNHQG